jgi:hypothetical protein
MINRRQINQLVYENKKAKNKKGSVIVYCILWWIARVSSMPRQVSIEVSGAMYHVMARGNRRTAIVQDDQDRGGWDGGKTHTRGGSTRGTGSGGMFWGIATSRWWWSPATVSGH